MQKAARTKARIERTALTLFAEKGVDQTTIRDIALGAGIAEGTIYRHFPSKEALIAEIFAENYGRLAASLDALQTEQDGLAAKLEAMAGRFFALFESDRDLFRFLFFVQHGQLEKLPPGSGNAVAVIRAILETAMAEGEIPRRDPDLATAWVFGAVTQPAVFRIYGRIERPLTELGRETAAACVAMLRA